MQRIVEPEVLDHLPEDHPDAIASRRDLRRINFVMGNERWILRMARNFPQAAARGIVEIGAGEGFLATKLQREFPDAMVTACDLARRPKGLDARIEWQQGDLFAADPPPRGGILVANLFLHHFEGGKLLQIGRLCSQFDVLILCEPNRSVLPLWVGRLAGPFINRVTRHDMPVSIRAGFCQGELAALLGLDLRAWRIAETSTWRGARRVIASTP
jgi:hypothetical protein